MNRYSSLCQDIIYLSSGLFHRIPTIYIVGQCACRNVAKHSHLIHNITVCMFCTCVEDTRACNFARGGHVTRPPQAVTLLTRSVAPAYYYSLWQLFPTGTKVPCTAAQHDTTFSHFAYLFCHYYWREKKNSPLFLASMTGELGVIYWWSTMVTQIVLMLIVLFFIFGYF